MAPETGHSDADVEAASAPRMVVCCRSSPDRFVFTEDGNVDGWIATDLVVEPER